MNEQAKPASPAVEVRDEESAVWAIVDLMGHRRLVGRLSEEEKFGGKLGRVDIPTKEGGFATRYFGAGSVYEISIVTEAVARTLQGNRDPAPVNAWDLPKQLPAARETPEQLFEMAVAEDSEEDDEDQDDRPDPEEF